MQRQSKAKQCIALQRQSRARRSIAKRTGVRITIRPTDGPFEGFERKLKMQKRMKEKDIDHHGAFMATQAARKAARQKRKKLLRKTRQVNDMLGYIDILICTGVTILFLCGNKALGLFAFVFLWLPCFFDITQHTITRPPWTTVKGEPDCSICHGKYFLRQGFLTYWIGWKECSCQPTRVFKEKEIIEERSMTYDERQGSLFTEKEEEA